MVPAHEDSVATSKVGPAPARLRIEADGPGRVVLHGEVDAATSWALAQALDDPDVVTIDCAGVSFLDAAGLRALLHAALTRRLTLRSPSTAVVRVLTVAGQMDEFDIEVPSAGALEAP